MAEDLRSVVVHEAILLLDGADTRSPGAAITAGLCGHWEHSGPCRWPHHTSFQLDGKRMVLRCVAVGEEPSSLHLMISQAVASGELDGPSGHSSWAVVSTGPSDLRPDEEALALRLVSSPGDSPVP